MTLTIEKVSDDKVTLATDFDFRDRDRIKEMPGARYSRTEKAWHAPLSWATCIAARGVFGDELTIGPELLAWATEYRETYVDTAMALREAWDAPGDDDLYPYQRAGVKFLSTVERAILGDEMGTGKTVMTIRTLRALVAAGKNPFPAIVIAPKSMVVTWKKEFARWMPEANVSLVVGSAAKRRQILEDEADVYIINFELVRTHSKLSGYGSIRLKRCHVCDPTLDPNDKNNAQTRCQNCPKELNATEWKTVIVDEAHKLKDPKSQQTRGVWALRTAGSSYIYGLTGTAIANAPDDFWSMLHFISKDEFPSKSKYTDRYCQVSANFFGGITILGLRPDTKEEFFSIIDPRLRRMPKEAVLPFLPKKTYSTRYVEMNPKQAKAYHQMENGLIAAIGADGLETVMASNPLTQTTRLSQFASAFAELDDEGHVRLSLPSNKVETLLEMLDDMGAEPAVVFAQSRQLIDLACDALEKKGTSFSRIVGGQTPDEREKAKDDFQNGHKRVILCTISAGGIGITLTRAATAIFMERSWSMVENKQAEDRVHRIGSEVHDKIQIIDILSTNTIEDRRMFVVGEKEERLEELMRDRQTVMRLLGAKEGTKK